MLGPNTVVFGDEEVKAPGLRIAIEATTGITRHIDIAIGISGNREGRGVGRRHTELAGVLLGPNTVVLGNEEVKAPSQRVAIKAAIGKARHIDITIGIGSDRSASGGCPGHTKLVGILFNSSAIILGDEEV